MATIDEGQFLELCSIFGVVTNHGSTPPGPYLEAANNLNDVDSVSASRTNLGLGTMATQAASSVAITGGAIDAVTLGLTTAISSLTVLGATNINQTGSADTNIANSSNNGAVRIGNASSGSVVLNGILNLNIAGTANTNIGSVSNSGTVAIGNASNNLMLNGILTINSSSINIANAASFRTALGLGTIATQNANSVAITGGTMSGVAITGGSINSATIGGSSASPGTFTNLTASGTINLNNTGTGVVNINTVGAGNTNIATVSNSGNITIGAGLNNATFLNSVQTTIAAAVSSLILTNYTGVLVSNNTTGVTASALTQHNVLVGGLSNALTSVPPSATSGIPFVSNGSSADPSFTTASVAGGGTGNAAITAYGVVIGGTTNTGALQTIAPVATGQVLVSGGVSAPPVFSATPNVTSISFGGGSALSVYTASGTFTPTLVGATTAGTTTYTNQHGYYTKIGERVFFDLVVSTSGMTGTGNLTLGGLPFTIKNQTLYIPTWDCRLDGVTLPTNGLNATCQGTLNTTNATFFTETASGVGANVQCANSGYAVYVSGSYQV